MECVKKIGVLSFLEKSDSFSEAISSLDNENSDMLEVYEAYIKIKALASPYLLFVETAAPICRAKDYVEATIANGSGVYIVNGEVRNLNLYSSEQDRKADVTLSSIILHVSENGEVRANNAFAKTNDRKARIEFKLDPRNKKVFVRCSAQKTSMFGFWVRCSTKIYELIKITDVYAPFDVADSGKVIFELEHDNNGMLQKSPFRLRNNSSYMIHLSTSEISEVEVPFGTFNLFEADRNNAEQGIYAKMKGSVEVWSRGIKHSQRAKDNINIDFSMDASDPE